MGKFEKDMTNEEKKALNRILSQQNYLKDKADIEYQCYVEKINFVQFWQNYLWDFMPETAKIVNNMFRPLDEQETIVETPQKKVLIWKQ